MADDATVTSARRGPLFLLVCVLSELLLDDVVFCSRLFAVIPRVFFLYRFDRNRKASTGRRKGRT